MSTLPPRRRAVLAGGAAIAAGLGHPGLAQSPWAPPSVPPRASSPLPPGQTVSLVVPYPPGGPTDVLARLLAAGLAERLGGAFVVENRPGASTTLAARQVARARPDGTALLLGTVTTFALAPYSFRTLGYDPVRDFAPITLLVDSLYVLVANPRWDSLAEVLAAARRRPGEISYASQGIGTTGHLPMVDLAGRAGVDLLHVPYNGTPPALTDTIAGRTDLLFALVPAAKPHLESGRLRPLATPAPARMAVLPDVPTLAELGFPGLVVSGWFSLSAPAGTPAPVIEALDTAVAATLGTPAARRLLDASGFVAMAAGPAALRDRIAADLASNRDLMRRAGIEPE